VSGWLQLANGAFYLTVSAVLQRLEYRIFFQSFSPVNTVNMKASVEYRTDTFIHKRNFQAFFTGGTQ
jgi:hypothetical protein